MGAVLRVLLVVAGLIFAISLVVAATIVMAIWGVRALWAKLTGRPVAPFVVRIDPRGGFDRMYRRARPGAPSAAPGAAPSAPREIGDVTDVQVKPPRD